MAPLSTATILMEIVCPSVGTVLAIIMYAAPVRDLSQALEKARLGDLNPLPWGIMSGACFGLCAYGIYAKDPYILCGNIIGWMVSMWLNVGAAKLQYVESQRNDPTDKSLSLSKQERLIFLIMMFWVSVLVLLQYIEALRDHAASIVGVLVNINLIAYFAAPLGTIQRVLQTKDSSCLHIPSTVMNITATAFWVVYGLAKRDPVIMVPNGIGGLLGVVTGLLCCIYPRDSNTNTGTIADDTDTLEESLVPTIAVT